MPRKAIGIVRVSSTNGRGGESFVSPDEQRERIQFACKRDGLELVEVYEELDVSGGKPLDQRPGLRAAVAAIEAGKADVVAAGYFDRLFRSLRTQAEVVDRIERAGGQVFAVDFGLVTNETAGQWLSAVMIGAVSEYYQRSAGERTKRAIRRAIERGVPPWNHVTLGYKRGEDGRYIPDPDVAPLVAKSFEMRVAGASVATIRAWLAENEVKRSFLSVRRLLESRVVLGEIHFGSLSNLEAHEPIVDRELWQRAQRAHISRGRLPKSDRLLARLGILLCSSCRSRMVIGVGGRDGRYPFYRCAGRKGDCSRRMSIGAQIVEGFVVEVVSEKLANAKGRASAAANVHQAQDAAMRARRNYQAAIEVLDDFTDQIAVDRLRRLRDEAESLEARADELRGASDEVVLGAPEVLRDGTLEEKRALIRAVVREIVIHPGRGRERIAIDLRS